MPPFLQSLIGSFYNPKVYRDTIHHQSGFGGRYLSLLTVILAVIWLISLLVSLHYFETRQLPHIAQQIPPIVINEGVIQVDAEQPVIINSLDNTLRITLDTEKSESELRETRTEITNDTNTDTAPKVSKKIIDVGIGRDFLFLKTDMQYKVFYTKELKDAKIAVNSDSIQQLWHNNKLLIKSVAFPILWLNQFFYVMVQCLIIAILSYAVTAFMVEEYNFHARMRLSAIALTPPVIIATLMNVILGHQATTAFVLLLATLYIYVMIHLMRKLSTDIPHSNLSQ